MKTGGEYSETIKKMLAVPRGSSIEEKLIKIRDSCPTEEDQSESMDSDAHVLPLNLFFELEESLLPQVVVNCSVSSF